MIAILIILNTVSSAELRCSTPHPKKDRSWKSQQKMDANLFICATDNDGKALICSDETIKSTEIKSIFLKKCVKGTEIMAGWSGLYLNNKVIGVNKRAGNKHIKMTNWYLDISKVGYYHSITFNQNLNWNDINTLHSRLQAQAEVNRIESKASAAATAFVTDLIGAIPEVGGLIAAFVKLGIAMQDIGTPEDDDHLKFLTFYLTMNQIWLKCGNGDTKFKFENSMIKRCYTKDIFKVSGVKRWNIIFNGCSGDAESDDYIRIYSNNERITVSGENILKILCGGGDAFSYNKIFDVTKQFCVSIWNAEWGFGNALDNDDLVAKQHCLNSLSSKNTVNIKKENGKTIKISFDIKPYEQK